MGTILDIIASTVIGGILLLMALSFTDTTTKNFYAHGDDLIVQQNLTATTTTLEYDLKKMGYGRDYKYPHNYDGHFVRDDYLPEKIKDMVFYEPSGEGSEEAIKKRLEKLWPNKYK